METPVAHRSFSRRLFSTPATTPDTVTRSSFSSQVWLHDWWLIRAGSDSHGEQIGVGGFAFRDGIAGPRRFFSAPIVKRQDAVTLKTVDGITVTVIGSLNKSQSLENGFSNEVCDHFVIGFPYYWEEFADLSVGEERVESCFSKGVPCSDAYETTSPKNHGTNTFDSTPSGKEETLQPIPNMVSIDHNTSNTKRKRSDLKSVIGDLKGADAYKTTSLGYHAFDSTPSEKKETLQPIPSMVNTPNTKKKSSDVKVVLGSSGPLTRSRARKAK